MMVLAALSLTTFAFIASLRLSPASNHLHLEGELVGRSGKSGPGDLLRDPTDFVDDRARPDYGGIKIGLALSLPHACLRGRGGHGLMRKDANVQLALGSQEVRGRDATRLELPSREPP